MGVFKLTFMINYPLKFTPILKEKIWGGTKLKNLLNKESNSDNVGESWEISGVPDNISIVKNGSLAGKSLQELIHQYKADLLGEKVFKKFGEEFPLLIKYIDAKTELSVQLHPNDKLAKERHNSFGKTEMWYIIQADMDAEINVGFKRTISKEEYLKHLEEGEIIDLLNFEKVKKGDSFFINTGKVHAIGAGVLLAEIQQTSDITYRIYDWDRVDSDGVSRELHTDLALEAIDFQKKDDFKISYDRKSNNSSNLAHCEYFTTNFLPVKGEVEKDYSKMDSFVIFMCVKGKVQIVIEDMMEKMQQGETILIPASIAKVKLLSENAHLLEVYIE